jgi:long-chain acyl-CoA synthetase
MLTHGNLLSNARAADAASPRQHDAILFNWLPFSHIYARTVDHYLSMVAGVPLCLAESPETVVANLGEIKPTHMSSVPRFYEKVLAAVQSADEHETGRRLREIFGPRLDWLGSGGAPLPPAIAHAFKKAGLLLLQGYGLTECAPVISFNRKTRYKLETVGQAIPGVEVAIAPDGEILTRGPHVMKGYWNNPQASTEAVRDGWLYTGDLGSLDDEGFLSITGRKKEILVTAGGKNVAPVVLEDRVRAHALVSQAMVVGEAKPFVAALVTLDVEAAEAWMKNQGKSGKLADLVDDPDLRAEIQHAIDDANSAVSRAEAIRKFAILPVDWTEQTGELTPTLKLKRSVVMSAFHDDVEALYR